MARSMVVLPAPLAPTTESVSPSSTVERHAAERGQVAVRHLDVRSSRRLMTASLLAEIGLDDAPVAGDLGGRPLGELLAVVQHDEPVGERHDRLHHVLDDEQAHAGGVHAADERDDLVDLRRIEPGHDLVEQEELRPGGEAARHLEPLPIRQRERPRGDVPLAARARRAR